jgi:hypothetical protein
MTLPPWFPTRDQILHALVLSAIVGAAAYGLHRLRR